MTTITQLKENELTEDLILRLIRKVKIYYELINLYNVNLTFIYI